MKWADNIIAQVEAKQAEVKTKVEISSEPPTYPIERMVSAEEGRRLIEQVIENFIRAAEEWHEKVRTIEEGAEPPAPPVHAMQCTTGGGKTDGVEIVFGADRARRRAAGEKGPMAERPMFYVTPIHKLNEEIETGFCERDLDARIFRGREQPDPDDKDHPEDREQRSMCWQLAKVKQATSLSLPIAEACCRCRRAPDDAPPRDFFNGRRVARGKMVTHECSDRLNCGYYRQTDYIKQQPPDVWLAANTMLFHPLAALGEVCAVVIDESFVMQGIKGGGDGYRLDDLLADNRFRRPLIEALAAQESDGGLLLASLAQRRVTQEDGTTLHRVEITRELCTTQHRLEWQFINENTKGLAPNMTSLQLKAIEDKGPELRRARFMAGVYATVREMIEKKIEASGRVILDTDKEGHRVVKLRGIHEVAKKWQRPTLIMDATLPTKEVLQVWYPQVEIVAEISIAAPHQHVRQVLGAPTAISKLFKQQKDKPREPKERNLHLVHRKIIELWLGSGKASTLVICQLDVELWLKAQEGLPNSIAIVHFNNFTGLDAYKDVDHIIVVGRTAVGPRAVEAMAGAMTGREPVCVPEGERWYGEEGRADRYIALAGGGTVRVEGDRHPDPLAEAMRWQVTEAGVIQGIGRGRGIHRTAANPLRVTILGNLCLPIAVDEVVPWQPASKIVEMLRSGLAVLGSATDAAKLWPKAWANWKAAERAVQAFMGRGAAQGSRQTNAYREESIFREMSVCSFEERAPLADWLPITYQHRARGAKHIPAMFDPAIVPFPRELLVRGLSDLGSLCHIVKQPKIGDFGGAGGLRVDVVRLDRRKALYGTAKATPKVQIAGPPGRYAAAPTPVWSGSAQGTEPVGVYEALPIELRMQALGLPLPSKWPTVRKPPRDDLIEKAEMWAW
jgi:hypothetical protein